MIKGGKKYILVGQVKDYYTYYSFKKNEVISIKKYNTWILFIKASSKKLTLTNVRFLECFTVDLIVKNY